MIERPQPPIDRNHNDRRDDASINALQGEIKQMKQDITFLKNLLEHLRGEFLRLKKQ